MILIRVISSSASRADLSRETIADLKKISERRARYGKQLTVTSSGEFSTSLPLSENDVYFLSLARE